MKKILAIIKDQEVEKAIERQLVEDKYHLSIARAGYDGVIKAKSLKPDIILCSYELPDMEGTEVLNELGSHGLLNFTHLSSLLKVEKTCSVRWCSRMLMPLLKCVGLRPN